MPIDMNENELKEKLDDEQYRVMRGNGTERAFTGKYHNHKEKGMYTCAACGQELFNSDTKFDSGSGWPSFDKPVNLEHVELLEDSTLGMRRVEVRCKNCSSHLGHVFEDGPEATTGERYCINSCALEFKE